MINIVEQRRNELLGKEFTTKSFGKCFIIDYKGNRDVTVMFYSPRAIVKCQLGALKGGLVRNPYYPSFYGVGYIGVGNYSAKNKEAYGRWTSILGRAYCEKYKIRFPAYKDVTVCEEWHNFQNFAEWYESQEFKGEGYELDKDILIKGNRVYCPTACRLVPSAVNKVLRNNSERRGALPIGMQEKCGRFYVKLSKFGEQVTVGSYESKEDAFSAYKSAREQYVKECAERYRQVMSSDVYESLCTYSVEIDD